MIAEPRTWVDVEAAVREWTRDSVDAIERRVFFGAKNGAAFPQVVVQRLAGTDDNCLIQFDVWGGTKAEAAAVAADLETQADALSRYQHDGILIHGARVDSVKWLPDPESDKPRYIVDVTFTATASE